MAPTLLLRAAALAVLPLAASAVPAHAAPGDNGDVKIHDSGTPADKTDDDPKVCKFYVDGLNFDPGQAVDWHIDQQKPTGAVQVLSGELTMPTGNNRTADQSLPDGHYKLFWNFKGEHGDAKQKVFEVDCTSASPSPSPVGSGTSPSPSPSVSASPSPGSSPGGPGGSGGPGRTPQGGVAAGAGGASRDWNPAEVTVGAALVAGAGFLVVRRRRRSRR